MHSHDECKRIGESSEKYGVILYLSSLGNFLTHFPFLNTAPRIEAMTARCKIITPLFSVLKNKSFLDDEC